MEIPGASPFPVAEISVNQARIRIYKMLGQYKEEEYFYMIYLPQIMNNSDIYNTIPDCVAAAYIQILK